MATTARPALRISRVPRHPRGGSDTKCSGGTTGSSSDGKCGRSNK